MHVIRCKFVWMALILAGCGGDVSDSNETPGTIPTVSKEDLLKGIVTATPPDTPETLARKRAQLEANLEQAQEAAEKGDLDKAIKLLEDAMMFDAEHRTVLMLLAKLSQTRSKALVTEDPARSYGLMRQSSGYVGRLREVHQDLTPEDHEFFANVLFDEACAHGRSKRQEEATGALHAAVAAGFGDLERLETEPDFAEFRKYPNMVQVLAEAASTIKSRAAEQAGKLLGEFQKSEADLSRLTSETPSIVLGAYQEKVLILVVGDPADERLQRAQDHWTRVQSRLASADLHIQQLKLDEKSLASLPGSPKPPVVLIVDRTGKLRLILTAPHQPAVLEAIVQQLQGAG